MQIMGIKSRTFDVPATGAAGDVNGPRASRVKLTDKERKRFQELIKNAKSLQEIARLEKEWSEGRIPGGVMREDT